MHIVWQRGKWLYVQDWRWRVFTEKENGMVKLESVKDVLFKVLLLGNIKVGKGMLYMEFYMIDLYRGEKCLYEGKIKQN